jgi:hypothetical protein
LQVRVLPGAQSRRSEAWRLVGVTVSVMLVIPSTSTE